MTTPIDIYGSAIPSRSDPKAFTAYAAAVMAAADYGAGASYANNVQSRLNDSPQRVWGMCLGTRWDWDCCDYRIAPSSRPKKFVTWRGPDDVPNGPAVWLRLKHQGGDPIVFILTGLGGGRLHFGGTFVEFPSLDSYHWSLDRITWQNCVVEVES